MSRAYRCDRCPALFEEHKPLTTHGEVYETQSEFYRVTFEFTVRNYDDMKLEPQLCEPCRADILNAITAKIRPTKETP